MNGNEHKGLCECCGRESHHLRVIYNSVEERTLNVCRNCYDNIDLSNRAYSKTLMIGCGTVVILALLVGFVMIIAALV